MIGDDCPPNAWWCHQCEIWHVAGRECPGREPKQSQLRLNFDPTKDALHRAIVKLGIWAVCVNCSHAVMLSNLTVCPRCLTKKQLIYIGEGGVLDAISAGIPGAVEAARAIYARRLAIKEKLDA